MSVSSSDIDKAVANLADKDARVRRAALEALEKSPKAVAQHGVAIARRLEDEDLWVRNAAVHALGESAEAVAQHGAAIAQRLEDEDWRVHLAVGHVLGKSPEAVAQLGTAIAQLLEHRDAAVRKRAAWALGKSPDDDISDYSDDGADDGHTTTAHSSGFDHGPADKRQRTALAPPETAPLAVAAPSQRQWAAGWPPPPGGAPGAAVATVGCARSFPPAASQPQFKQPLPPTAHNNSGLPPPASHPPAFKRPHLPAHSLGGGRRGARGGGAAKFGPLPTRRGPPGGPA